MHRTVSASKSEMRFDINKPCASISNRNNTARWQTMNYVDLSKGLLLWTFIYTTNLNFTIWKIFIIRRFYDLKPLKTKWKIANLQILEILKYFHNFKDFEGFCEFCNQRIKADRLRNEFSILGTIFKFFF